MFSRKKIDFQQRITEGIPDMTVHFMHTILISTSNRIWIITHSKLANQYVTLSRLIKYLLHFSEEMALG
jgi:hypothetical protein